MLRMRRNMTHQQKISMIVMRSALALGLCGCAADSAADEPIEIAEATEELGLRLPFTPTRFTPFTFESKVSQSGAFDDGDVRLDAVVVQGKTIPSFFLATVRHAEILIDDGVDVNRGGHNLASGQGINSELDDWAPQGPATIEPTGDDLAASLGNYNLTSIVVTRENVGTASIEITFPYPVNRLFFWERGSVNSPTTANSDLLVEALDWRGRVVASTKLLRTQYVPTGIEITTWNGSFASPSSPTGVKPQLGAAGLALNGVARRFRLTSVQEPEGGVRDDGPDYKVIGALLPDFRR